MAAESNMGFHFEETLGSALCRHAISFQSGAINSTPEMIPMGNYYGVNSTAGMILPGNSNIINNNPGMTQAGNTSGSLLLDSVPGLKHDTVLAVEWSVEEEYKLLEGLVKYADEPSIMRYIKIAATLRDKTVRDVALRCRWMTKKRRKQEDHNVGKKVKDRKDKLVESSSKTNVSSVSPLNMAAYPFIMHHRDQSQCMPCEALSGTTRHLLEQNNQILDQISANLSTLKLRDNINLLFRTKNNITAILNDMRDMPGLMRMPPLPVSINEELANSILPSTTQSMFGSSNGIHLKQEPRC
uniref:Myb-like domain-containing protein n=1 Tax=Davidia involucrata TaxID=16924 RepID=A0A5B7CIC7_DAVIN